MAGLRRAYDEQVRTAVANRLPAGRELTRQGPLVRVAGGFRGFVGYRDLAGLVGSELDALIEDTIDYFDRRGEPFEWKWHEHDHPADLPDRLAAHGFVAEALETVLVGRAAELTELPAVEGVVLREITGADDFHALGRMESEVWGEDWSWLAEDLIARRASEGDLLRVFGAYGSNRELVSAAWLVFNAGTEFAGLWGGSTLAGWRGRGIYRALV
ncbi:MAG TPA: GNAT family N-acetyltransferase, partial [Jatrophihabitans sp.]|nr:GNAT family N-acetyltransferase [Jatrophihabitans sp.]